MTNLLVRILSSGLAFAFIWAVRKTARRLPPASLCVLWCILFVRLLVPWSLEVPIPSSLDALPATVREEVREPRSEGSDAYEGSSDAPQTLSPASAVHVQSRASVARNEEAAPAADTMDAELLAFWIWLSGVLANLLYFGTGYIQLRKQCMGSQPSPRIKKIAAEIGFALHLRSVPPVVVCPALRSPALTAGLFAKVLLPVDIAVGAEDKLHFALLHELTHKKRHDNLLNMLAFIARTLNWFNPFAWLAFRYLREDMEKACDQAVTRSMDPAQKAAYAQMIVCLVGASPAGALGMALGKTAQQVARRVRGVFRPTSLTRRSICASALLAVLLCVIGFSVPVSAAPDAVDAAVSTGIQQPQTARDEQFDWQMQQLGLPSVWDVDAPLGSETHMKGTVVPSVPQCAVPMATAEVRMFTQTEIDKIAEDFFGTDARFVDGDIVTKEMIQMAIDRSEALLEGGELTDDETGRTIEGLSWLKNQMRNALAEAELETATATLAPTRDESGFERTEFRVRTTRAQTPYVFECTNDPVAGTASLRVETLLDSQACGSGSPVPCAVSEETARNMATEYAKRIAPEYILADIGKAAQGWSCVFERAVHGVRTAYVSRDIGDSMEADEIPPGYERLTLLVNDAGIGGLVWNNPMRVLEETVVYPDLIPFATAAQSGLAELRAYWSGLTGDKDIVIDRAELGLMRVTIGEGTYRYEPVWVFAAAYVADDSDRLWSKSDPDPAVWAPVTVSAIDGQVMDRCTGARAAHA